MLKLRDNVVRLVCGTILALASDTTPSTPSYLSGSSSGLKHYCRPSKKKADAGWMNEPVSEQIMVEVDDG